ncbi:MAG TPA: epoxyqueuosine reductase QueH [Bacillota bacterium]|nr:epoxyqueuosine reductase QueH [Bacillota bacterium]
MKLLLHICCGPCATYPVNQLRTAGVEAIGYFYNPNIHPYREFKQRLAALQEYADAAQLNVIYNRSYDFEEFLRLVVFHEQDRCQYCYKFRLEQAARAAAELGCTHLTSTLLVSPYQKHDLIHRIGDAVAAKYGLEFYYEDWRGGFREGQQIAQNMGLYRQPYCGCIYSEAERYCRQKRKRAEKE